MGDRGKRGKGQKPRLTVLLIFILILSLSATACRSTNPPPEPAPGDKIAAAKNYLQKMGLNPLQPLTSSSEGTKRTFTLKAFNTGQEVELLDEFLNNFIQDTLHQNGDEPVELSYVSFQLEDEHVADVYFYQDEIVGGVMYPRQEIDQERKNYRSLKGETLAQLRGIDFPVWRTGESPASIPAIFYLEANQAKQDGFEHVVQTWSLGQGRFLLVFKNDAEIRAYVYDLQTGKDFYTGISTTEDYLPLRVKPLAGNQVAVMLQDKLLLVDRQDFRVLKELGYPDDVNMDDLDISPDGRIIVAGGRGGLRVYDGNFENGKTLVPAKIGTDPYGRDSEHPRHPVLSPDSSRILYRVVGYEWLVGTGTIALDGSDHRFFKADQAETTYFKWYDNSHIYSDGSSAYVKGRPVIRNIVTGEERYLLNDVPEDKNYRYFLGKNDMLFILENVFDENFNYVTTRLGYYDPSEDTVHILMENPALWYLDWYLSAYDELHNAFVFGIGNPPLASRPAILVGLPQVLPLDKTSIK